MSSSTPHSYSLDAAISALSSSPDGRFLTVVGRDILKVLEWKDQSVGEVNEHWELVKNFRSGRINLNYSSVDVQWNPKLPHLIGTAATNGAIVIWNVNRDAKKQERVIKEHNRTVNRINWHPNDGNLLLSASQDGTVRFFDIRDKGSNLCYTSSSRATEVRDVQFHPFHPNYFATANDNGTIQVWDTRKNTEAVQVITAHQGLLLAIDWHPSENSENLIASAGRDRLVKVWDLKKKGGSYLSASHLIQTTASVGRVKWRPSHANQLASTSSVVDSRIHIWDTKQVNIPSYTFSGHTDIVTAILFDTLDPHGNTIISGSKDGTIKRFNVSKHSTKYCDLIPTTAIDWKPDNELSYCFESIQRPSGKFSNPMVRHSPASVNLATYARRTTLQDMDVESLFEGKLRPIHTLSTRKNSQRSPSYIMFNGGIFTHFAKKYKYEGSSLKVLCEYNKAVAEELEQIEIAQIWEILKLLYSVQKQKKPKNVKEKSFLWDNYSDIIFDEPYYGKYDEMSYLSYSDVQDFDMNSDSEINTVIDIDSIEESLFEQSAIHRPYTVPTMNTKRNREFAGLTLPEFQFQSTIEDMLDFHAEQGDVQTCVTVLIVLGKKISISEQKKHHWFHSYIELLQQFELFSEANDVIKHCTVKEIRTSNQKGTTFQIGCSSCRKTLTNKAWRCEKCSSMKCCSICLQPVKGLYVWCQGCGHGGHLQHLKDWFDGNSLCPTAGCGHICTLSS